MNELKNYLSVREAAAELDYSVSYVNRLIREGRLNACMIGRQYVVHRDDVENWEEKRKI